AEKGKLIVKEYYELGGVRGSYQTSVKISAAVLYTPGEEDERVRGLRFTVEGGGKDSKCYCSCSLNLAPH
ncbi:unnamed protein product, partial [marine sediment metagenome]